MSYSAVKDPSDVWLRQEQISSTSSGTESQFLGLNSNRGVYSNFQQFIHQQPEQIRTSISGECQVSNTELAKDMDGSGNFTSTYLPGASIAISPRATKELTSRGRNESFLTQNSAESEIQAQFIRHQEDEQQKNLSINHIAISPITNSNEMCGFNSLTYVQSDYQQQQQQPATYDIFRMHGNEQENNFTPIISPAVTPLEYQLNALRYTLPESHFSPLCSPALHAQNDYLPFLDQRSSLFTNSPILSADVFPGNEVSETQARNPDPKASKTQTRNSFRVKKLPAVNSIRGIKSNNTMSQSLDRIDLSYSPSTISKSNTYSMMTLDESPVSSEILSSMAPPPAAINPSTRLRSKTSSVVDQNTSTDYPATPTSLLKITQSSKDNIELVPIETTNLYLADTPTSQDSSFKLGIDFNTNKSCIESAPKILESAVIEAKKSEFEIHSPKVDCKLKGATIFPISQHRIHNYKKRTGNIANSSPALLPRPSPKFQPLPPNAEKDLEGKPQLILTHESNSLGIPEDTNFSGGSHSSELYTSLKSKRTSHKIAEQGRRNRMNSALQELSTLLPRGQARDQISESSKRGDAVHSEGSKGTSHSTSSKARTVEQAIVYINYLKCQLEIANKKLEQATESQET